MDIAAIIMSTLALCVSLVTLTWQLAKHFSSHKIQYVPLEDPFLKELDPQKPDKTNPSMAEIYKTIDQMDPDEEKYFKEQNEKARAKNVI